MFGTPSFGIIINSWHLIHVEKRHAHVESLNCFNAATKLSLPGWTSVLEKQPIASSRSMFWSLLLRSDLCGVLLKDNSLPLYCSYNSTESPLQRHLHCAVTQQRLDFHYKGIIAFNLESRRWHVGVGDGPGNREHWPHATFTYHILVYFFLFLIQEQEPNDETRTNLKSLE